MVLAIAAARPRIDRRLRRGRSILFAAVFGAFAVQDFFCSKHHGSLIRMVEESYRISYRDPPRFYVF
tara:strand:- start:82 stop:282 length:201 start_codon:yes stop_codon:yes gene_type:complete